MFELLLKFDHHGANKPIELGKNENIFPGPIDFNKHEKISYHDELCNLIGYGYRNDYSTFYNSLDCIVIVIGNVFRTRDNWPKNGIDAKEIAENIELLENPHINLRGNYNIIYYNKEKRELTIISDPLALIPLYYGVTDNSFIVSTSLYVIRKWFKRISVTNLVEKLIFNYNIDNSTIYEGVYTIKPSEKLFYKKGIINNIKYFDLRDYIETGRQQNFSLEQYNKLIDELIRNRYCSDEADHLVSLTGGNDGRAIVALLLKNEKYFETYSYSQRDGINMIIPEKISKKLEFKHHSVYLENGFLENYVDNALKTIEMSDANLPFWHQSTYYAFLNLPSKYDKFLTGLIGGEILGPIHLIHDYFNINYYNYIYKNEEFKIEEAIERIGIGKYIKKELIGEDIESSIKLKIKERRKFIDSVLDSSYQQMYYLLDLMEVGFRRFYGSQIHLTRYYGSNLPVFYDLDLIKYIFSTDHIKVYSNAFKSKWQRRNSRKVQSFITYNNHRALARIPLDRGFSVAEIQHPVKKYLAPLKYFIQKKHNSNKNKDFNTAHWSKRLFKELLSNNKWDSHSYFEKKQIRNDIEAYVTGKNNYNPELSRLISVYLYLND